MKTININDSVKVKLTPYGKEMYVKHYKDLFSYIPNEDRCLSWQFDQPPKEDDEGYYHDEMWSLMMIFGKHMYMGCKQVFDSNTLIIEE